MGKISDHWIKMEVLNLFDAIRLICNIDPKTKKLNESQKEEIIKYEAILTSAIQNGSLRYIDKDGNNIEGSYSTKVDFKSFRVARDHLGHYLKTNDITDNIFFEPQGENLRNPDGQYYSPKLVAAIDAWVFLANNPSYVEQYGTPKKACMKWLQDNGAKYGLLDDQNTLITGAAEEISIVMNWRTKGGAPKANNSR